MYTSQTSQTTGSALNFFFFWGGEGEGGGGEGRGGGAYNVEIA